VLRRLYNWVVSLAEDPRAVYWLAMISFAESSFFPIPPDALLVPMATVNPQRAYLYALVCTLSSVAGGFLGYAIGYFFFETMGKSVLAFYGLEKSFETFQLQFQEWGLWIILIKGLTPIPYKLVTIAAGAAHFDLFVFAIASLVTRGARFFLECWLLKMYGPPIRHFIEHRLELVTTALLVLIVGGFLVLRYL
jgi:membrane protein YqaA with SNARE-associated domain